MPHITLKQLLSLEVSCAIDLYIDTPFDLVQLEKGRTKNEIIKRHNDLLNKEILILSASTAPTTHEAMICIILKSE